MINVNFKKLKEYMKRKTTVLLLSLFFVSSVVAISSVNNGSQMAIIADYDSQELISDNEQIEQVYILDSDIQLDAIEDSNNESEELVAVTESTEVEVIDYQTDSDILLVESKADKARLKKQKQEAEKERQAKLTEGLNEQEKIAFLKRLQESAEPAKTLGTKEVVVKAAEAGITNKEVNQPQVAALTTEQQVTLKRKALNLAPPIPPGTLGGGNGNGGPGAASTTSASAN